MKKLDRREFGFVNLVVTKDSVDDQIRMWACNKEGVCVFRLKAMGKVTASDDLGEIIVTSHESGGGKLPVRSGAERSDMLSEAKQRSEVTK